MVGADENEDLKIRNIYSFTKEDLIDLPFLNEPEILHALRSRYELSHIFTNAGPILLMINPFSEVDPSDSSMDVMRRFVEDVRRTAGQQYSGSIKNHSILISGESGSGKTESFKIILNIFGRQISPVPERVEWFQKILLAHKVLESFGNARTTHTANSSRFGKVAELNLNRSGVLVGSSIRTYLLESSRTTNQQLNERNFNIFYELLAGASAEERGRWGITRAGDYHYTNQGGAVAITEQESDIMNYAVFKDNLLKIGFDEVIISTLLDIVVGILSLGDVKFEDMADNSGGCKITDSTKTALENVAKLFGVETTKLEDLLITKNLPAPRGETIVKRLNKTQANIAKDAVAKAIYRGIFEWLAGSMNQKLQSSNQHDEQQFASTSSVMLVDIFGFDSFHYNSIDQLCINYSNEVLQQLFNYNVFKREIELYTQEGIPYDNLIFSDNKDNIELISSGIFRILDDQCRIPDPTDKRFVAQLYKEFSNHRLFSANTVQMLEQKFSIQHFSGQVEYTVDDFIVKNSDTLPADTGKFLLSANNALLLELVKFDAAPAAAATVRATRRKSQFMATPVTDVSARGNARHNIAITPSFVAQVKADLALLVKEVEPTVLHYVRCIKPYSREEEQAHCGSPRRGGANQIKKVKFSHKKVAEQLRYGGVFEAIRTTRTKYRAYLSFVDFYSRYHIVANHFTSSGFNGPRCLPAGSSRDEQAEWCKKLIHVLSTKIPSYTNKRISGKLSRANSIQQMAAMIGSDQTAIDPAQIPIGNSLIFVKVKEYELLESLRNTSVMAFVVVIQTLFRRHITMLKYRKRKHHVELLQRVIRGHLARLRCRRLRFLTTAVISVQRLFRKRLFNLRILRIQMAYRCHLARVVYGELKDKKDRLYKLYGPLVTARELRIKRRKEFSGGNKLDIRNIRSLESRFAEYSIQEAELVRSVVDLVTPSKLDEKELQQELEFDKITAEISTLYPKLRNERVKNDCVSILKRIKLAEHLLKTRNLSDNTFFGRMAGPGMFKSFMGMSLNDIPKVNLNEKHALYVRLTNLNKKMNELKKQLAKENERIEKLRSDVRTKGSGERGTDTDAVISAFLFQLKTIRKLISLLDVLERYYLHFIVTFSKEYGADSEFHKTFSDEKSYLRALYDVVRAAKRYQPRAMTADLNKKGSLAKNNVYRVGNCPLKVDWQETLTRVDPVAASNLHRSIALNPNEIRSLLSQSQDAKAKLIEENSEVLRLLKQLEIKKREFNQDNLRIVVFENIGYQYMPIDPAVEYSMNLFSRLLSGSVLNARRLIKLAGTRHLAGKVAYYQACRGISKLSLLDVLYSPLQVEKIDYLSFSSTVLTCLVMGITNLHPNHILMEFDSKTETYQMAAFNNDYFLSCGFLDFHNRGRQKVSLKNMNVLFFLPQMDEPIDADVRAFLTSSPYIAEEIVTSWLRDLYDQNRRYMALKSAGLTNDDFENLNFPFKLPAGVTVELRKRLMKLSNLLRPKRVEKSGELLEYVTHHQILEALYPSMSNYYRKARLNSDFRDQVDVSGLVSYAYVYHEAIDSERHNLGNRNRANNTGAVSSFLPSVLSPITSQFFRPHPDASKRKADGSGEKKEKERKTEGGDDEDDDGSSSDEDSAPIDESVFRRVKSTAFNYDQIYVGSNGVGGEQIPGVEQLEENDASHILDQSHYSDAAFEDSNVDGVRSPGTTNRSLVLSISTPLQYDTIYGQDEAGGATDADSSMVYESPPTPFRMIKKGVILNRSSIRISEEPQQTVTDSATPSSNPSVDGSVHSTLSRSHPSAAGSFYTPKKTESLDFTNANNNNEERGFDYAESDKGNFESAPPSAFRKTPKKSITAANTDMVDESRVDFMTCTVEQEGFEFINSFDWRDFADNRSQGQAEEFCEMMGKNLGFLEIVSLNYINDWQLQSLFKYWIRLYKKQQVSTAVKPLIREVILRYDNVEDMHKMKDCIVLIQLKSVLRIDVKFAVLSSLGEKGSDQYDLYAYSPPPGELDALLRQSLGRESDKEDDLLSFKEREISRKLLRVLWSVLNTIKKSEIDSLETDIRNVKKIVYMISREQHQDFTLSLLTSFNKLLLQYPGLIPIGQVIAARRGFLNDGNYCLLHKLIAHPNVECYLDMILSIAYNIPEFFVVRNAENELPCDLIKRIPDVKKCRFYLMSRCINNFGAYSVRNGNSNPIHGSNPSALLSQFSGEEELICVSAQLGFRVTASELKLKHYDFSKRDHRGFSLLQLLIIKDASGSETVKQNCWKVYEILLHAIYRRVQKHNLNSRAAAHLIMKCLDLEKVKAEKRDEWKLCKVDESKIMKDIRTLGTFEHGNHHNLRRAGSATLAAIYGVKF